MTKLYRKTSAASAKPVAKFAKVDRVSIYDEVTASIIEQLESGVAPWAKPWVSTGGSLGMPMNGKSGRHYSGINVLLLWNAMQKNAYSSPYFFTFKQALDMGGSVRKGEKATKVVYADSYIPKEEREAATREGREPSFVPFLRGFYVFNAEQCEGLPARFTMEPEPVSESVKHMGAERLFAASGARVRLGGSRAFFSPSDDYIGMPLPTSFRDPLDFYRTGLHELTHWTGHESRLARTFGKRFADSAYAREELVAELGAAFLCASVGIQPTVNHASYLDHWIKVLREDSRAIFQAASLASKAADYLFGLLPKDGPGGDPADDGEDDASEPVAAPVEHVEPAPLPEPVAILPEPVAAPVEPVAAPRRRAAGKLDYYATGHRMTIGGVPCRVARKPATKNHAAMLRGSNPFAAYSKPGAIPMREDEAGLKALNAWLRRIGYADRWTPLPASKRRA